MTLADAIDGLVAGAKVGPLALRAANVRETGLNGKHALDVIVEGAAGEHRLVSATVYHGRLPHYQPWVELMDWASTVSAGGDEHPTAGSDAEAAVLDAFANELGPGGRIFVEYEWDAETARQLGAGVPPAASRIGHLLWQRGFTWYKDWYYPEGGQEGGLKLQAEKPYTDDRRAVHEADVRAQLETWLARPADEGVPNVEAAVERGRAVLGTL